MATRTRFVLLRHASELTRTSNSGRWAALALPGARLIDYALPGPPPDLSVLLEPGTAVLFPSPHPPRLAVPPRQVVVLDATWAQARRMLQRIPALRALPRLGLPAPAAQRPAPMREATVAGGISTLEAMAGALDLLGEPEAARALEALHAAAMERAWLLRRGASGASQLTTARSRGMEILGGRAMPVSKKRKKDGKPVHRQAPLGEEVAHVDHPEGPPLHPDEKAGKPKNPFVAHQPQIRGSQRGR